MQVLLRDLIILAEETNDMIPTANDGHRQRKAHGTHPVKPRLGLPYPPEPPNYSGILNPQCPLQPGSSLPHVCFFPILLFYYY